jgi:hypothetical protein
MVTNLHTSPITEASFPHYHAMLFFAPKGWTSESTFLVNVGVEDRPGVCTARAVSPADAIVPRGSATFSMQVSTRGTRRGRGTVQLRFADGAEIVVPNVELPVPEGLGDRYVPLIGLGGIAAAFIVVRALRRRRQASA